MGELTFSDAQLEEIADRLALRLNSHGCSCGLSQEAQSEMIHFWGMLKDESDGNLGRGVESLRGVIQADKRARKWGDVIARVMVGVVVVAFTGAVMAGIIAAIKKTFAN